MSLSAFQGLRAAVFFTALGLLGIAESFRPARKWESPRRRRWFFHVALSIFNTILTRALVGTLIIFLIQQVRAAHWGLAQILGWQGAAEIAATVVFFDAMDYWWHRFNHRCGFFWRFHRAHHIDTHVDVTTALRFHPGELILSYAVKCGWIVLWGPSLAGFMAFETLTTLYSQFHHTNIDFPDTVEKIFRRIHMTPRVHASHHTVAERSRDGNFSTIFIWWDTLFGTFREPDFAEMKRLGLPEGRESDLSPRAFLLAPFSSR